MARRKNPIIKLDKISKIYDEYGNKVKALDNVSLEIFPGEFVSIIGPSGCGKSTLLHCMGILDRPSSGIVYIDNKDTSKISGKEIAQFRGMNLGFVFQNYNLIPRLTVLENVMLPGLIIDKDPEVLRKRSESLLKEVGIFHRINHKGIHLSGGEQQRVAIARALVNNPSVVLADEPTGALDSENSIDLMNVLVKLNQKRHSTFVFVSHDLEIAKYGERTIALMDGKIVGDTNGDKKNFEKILKNINNKNKKRKKGK